MSAPDTNVKKQEKQHRGSLWGIWAGLGFVAVLFVVWLLWVFANGQEPTEPSAQVDDFTGQVEQVDEGAAVQRDTEEANTVPAGADAVPAESE